jgi:CTP:molybdopterin cytidylyltransferase MocA
MIAAITAGGRVDGELANAMGTAVKALAPIGGSTPLEAAISGARAAGAERIVVIGGNEVRARVEDRVDAVIDESSDGRENIRRAIGASGDKPFLLLASDMPFLSDAAVAAFVTRARAADVALPLADAGAYAARYPGAPPHATNLGRERIVNGSVVYFGPGVAPRVLEISQRLFVARKSLVRMAVLLGPALLLRFLTRTLAIEHIEARATQLFGIRAHAVRDSDPGLCFDIDSIEDYRYACEHLAAAR